MNEPKKYKNRHRRDEPIPDSAVVVVRGDLLEEAELREDANENHELYGFWAISVFAADDDARLEEHAATKLVRARILVLIKVGDLLDAGLELCDTGQAPHYDDPDGQVHFRQISSSEARRHESVATTRH